MPSTPKAAPAPEQQAKPGTGGSAVFKFIGPHATILESGQPLGPGEYVTLDDVAGHDQMLLEEGYLISAEGIDIPEQQTTE